MCPRLASNFRYSQSPTLLAPQPISMVEGAEHSAFFRPDKLSIKEAAHSAPATTAKS